jgi:hypothetical protein
MIPIIMPIMPFVIPAVLRAIVGIFPAIVDVIPSENAPWMLPDLLLDGWVLLQEFFYVVMLVKVLEIVNQLRVALQIRGNARVFHHESVKLRHFVAHLVVTTPSRSGRTEHCYGKDQPKDRC